MSTTIPDSLGARAQAGAMDDSIDPDPEVSGRAVARAGTRRSTRRRSSRSTRVWITRARARSKTPKPTVAGSSVGTTTSTVIPASGSTPADVHYGRAEAVRQQRAVVLDAAYAQHPECFVRKPPRRPALPIAAWINEPQEDAATTQ